MTGAPSYNKDELIACGRGELFGAGNAQLPTGNMLMIDRIVHISSEGGAYGKGEVVAELDINPDLWFFKYHFPGDPVMPGCLGLDAMWQLLGFFLAWRGNPGRGRALGCGLGGRLCVRLGGDLRRSGICAESGGRDVDGEAGFFADRGCAFGVGADLFEPALHGSRDVGLVDRRLGMEAEHGAGVLAGRGVAQHALDPGPGGRARRRGMDGPGVAGLIGHGPAPSRLLPAGPAGLGGGSASSRSANRPRQRSPPRSGARARN